MENLSAWLGAGIVTAGMSAALLAGAGVAGADTDSGSDSGGAGSSDAGASAKPDKATTPDKSEKPDASTSVTSASTKPDESEKDTEPAETAKPEKDEKPAADDETETAPDETEPDDATEEETETAVDEPIAETPTTSAPASKRKSATETVAPAEAATAPEADVAGPVTAEAASVASPETHPEAASEADVAPTPEPAPAPEAEPALAPVALRQAESTTSLTFAQATAVTPDVSPAASLLGFVGSVIGAVVVNVGSLALTALQAVEALAAGPPVLPPGSTVTVRDSYITLGTGQRIAANWYYPEGDTVPDRMIMLQHGFLALGPMYSYTAANLAERTNSIVVTPSIPSNIFLGDDHWLGGIGMASQIADLFGGDRTALTQSALDTGFAQRYGLTPAEAQLPEKFALVGHSLGGQLVSATAGFLAENGAAEDLVGVITLDGVPFGGTMEDALAKLDAYETATGHYIPIREIGAPWNLYNAFSNLKEALNTARPDHFNGVVLTGGVHMDSMQGGNQLIQFAAYVAAGFPEPQNPPAVQELSVRWLEEWFGPAPGTGNPFIGDDLVHGSTFDVVTPEGTAEATVIGDPPALRMPTGPLPAGAPTDVPSTTTLLTTLAV